ncbi:flavoprotein, HI0933 family [Rubidibacter lacunae KORDI 51-2]|uniref:Flavoprotein, HI0933 family n=1 Tax=Rubidibacter lacunae KORDI 51-2 TaxID=582515 RepID=U5DJ20_9CHRO|nr:NAD(P)/FAD-dependent oxidoreductase [Rubidibacter lacunae]ERN40932.1 flavoprotein, HI0933 family [Rubidibacter lacunae KORDI 51-2]
MQIAIVGGGAAGFFGAIAAATTDPTARVMLLEAGRHPLAKVRISGGGRCNVTHHCFDPATLVQSYPRGGRALRGAFSRFQPRDTVAWFATRGVALKTEADGRMFPTTDDSETIVTCLLDAAERAGVELRTGARVSHVRRLPEGRFALVSKSEELHSDRVLLATGSSPQGHLWARELGHAVNKPVPSLFTFELADPQLLTLAGVSIETVRLRLHAPGKQRYEQTGPLLIAHWGLTGPAVLKLSAWAARVLHECNYQLPLSINWVPSENPETVRACLLNCRSERSRRQIGTACPLPLPRRVWHYLLQRSHIDRTTHWAEVANKAIERTVNELTRSQFEICGKGQFKDEFVTCGGVALKDVNFKTMESRRVPGLYLAGEVLDIDGITGGFNFQAAWTTGWLAGCAMVAPFERSNIPASSKPTRSVDIGSV